MGRMHYWHADSHHKLIRWKFVTHGCIDGYSRSITCLTCADNNQASTAYQAFSQAVHLHGLPHRVRTDCGGENVDIWRFMIDQHSTQTAVITGSSTHNERIERLWRDVHRCVTSLFYDSFSRLESQQKLDPLSADRNVFLPQINRTLNDFVETWNNHPVSTSQNLTPNQMFIRGAIDHNMVPAMPRPTQSVSPSSFPTARNHVNVSRIRFIPCQALKQELELIINPIAVSDNMGCDIYHRTINTVGLHLHSPCSHCS